MTSQYEPVYKLISIDGNIGSGKSTLMKYLKNKYSNRKDVVFLDEPVDEWAQICDSNGETMLEKFYKNQNKYAFSFQMMAYISRLAMFQKKLQSLKHSKSAFNLIHTYYIFTERSLETDREIFAKMLYDQNKIEDVNYKIYMQWFDHFACTPDIYIYLKTNPELCLERIKKRSRTGENSIQIEYLKECHQYHDVMFDNSQNNKKENLLILDGNKHNHVAELAQELEMYVFPSKNSKYTN